MSPATAAAHARPGLLPLFPIASGGMAEVHLVLRDEGHFKRLFALKRLHPHLRSDAALRRMFLDEARVAGLLRHPNVVAVLDVGDDEGGPFLIMPWVAGVSAAELLADLAQSPLPIQAVLEVGRQIADALDAAHELRGHDGTLLGLVHRDVSPHNVLVDHRGLVQLTDFGVAKALGRLQQTGAGLLKGKLGYMAPEQLRYEEPDRRSDLFSFGVVLHELTTGKRLYDEAAPQPPAPRILNEPPIDPSRLRADVPVELSRLVLALLAKDPDARPATAAEVKRALEAIGGDGGTLAGEMERRFGGRRREEEARIAEAIARVDRERVAPPPSPSGSRRTLRMAAWAGAIATLFAGLAALWAGRQPRQQVATPMAAPSPAANPAPAPTSSPLPAPRIQPARRSTPPREHPRPVAKPAGPKSGFPTWGWE